MLTTVPDSARLLPRVIRRCAAHATYRLATTPARTATWWKVRIRHHHRRTTAETWQGQWREHVAIVAVHPRIELTASVERLLDTLGSLGVTVVMVVNDSPDAGRCIDVWRDRCDGIVQRGNIGRDFGAYQAGVRYILRHGPVERIGRLSFFNDSVVYLPHTDRLLSAWWSDTSGCTALCTSQVPRPHLQGFAFSLDGACAFGPAARRFWDRYYPSGIRHEVIRRGELGLSDMLRAAGCHLAGHLDAALLDTALDHDWGRLTTSERRAWEWSIAHHPRLAAQLDLRSGEIAAATGTRLRSLADDLITATNPSHSFGLTASRLVGFPVKLDLVAVGAASRSDMAELLESQGIDDDERAALLSLGATRTAHGDATGWQRLWRGAGLW